MGASKIAYLNEREHVITLSGSWFTPLNILFSSNMIVFYFNFMYVLLYVCARVRRCPGRPEEGFRPHSCHPIGELSDMGAGNSAGCNSRTSHLPSSLKDTLLVFSECGRLQ